MWIALSMHPPQSAGGMNENLWVIGCSHILSEVRVAIYAQKTGAIPILGYCVNILANGTEDPILILWKGIMATLSEVQSCFSILDSLLAILILPHVRRKILPR